MIELHPGTADTETHHNIFVHSDLAWTWWKMIELHAGTADQKLHLNLFTFRFSLYMVKDDWLPTGTVDHKLSSHILHSDLDCTWEKMIDLHPGSVDQNIT